MHPARRAALAAMLPLLLSACFERVQPSVENMTRPVQAVRVALASDTEQRAFAGIVRPRHEADIGFRAGGRIATREVDVGARVVAGQLLARLDPIDLALGVRSAEADVASAEAQAVQAQADAERSRTLRAQGWTAAAVDEVKQAAAHSAAERVAGARAALALARNKLDYAELRAPADGVVMAPLADPGTVVSEGQPVLHLAESATPEAEIALPEQALPDAARPGAVVTLWARADLPLHATLRELAPAADGKLRTFNARYTIADPPAWLALGLSVTLHLPGAQADGVATLPSAALVDRGQGPMVWAVGDDGKLVSRPVQVRRLQQDRVVVSGLSEGELVVALGGQKLDPAARVRVADIHPATE
jgi:membrane fusion protein, multidrug efflux system